MEQTVESPTRYHSGISEPSIANEARTSGVSWWKDSHEGASTKGDPHSRQNYLSQLVATRTGLTSADAEKRVSDVFTSAQQAAETARKTVAHSLLWAFLALLIGAFCASLGATIGGRQRDHVVVV